MIMILILSMLCCYSVEEK